jgi:hypothetical protein
MFIIANNMLDDRFTNLNKNIKHVATITQSKAMKIVNQLYQSLYMGKKIKIDNITIGDNIYHDKYDFFKDVYIINYSDRIRSGYILRKINKWFIYADTDAAYVKNIKKVLYQIFDYYPTIKYEIL